MAQYSSSCGLTTVTYTQNDAWLAVGAGPATNFVTKSQAEQTCTMYNMRLPTLSEIQNGCVLLDSSLEHYDVFKTTPLWSSTQKADYHFVNNGRCEDYIGQCQPITSSSECNAAANYLGLSDTDSNQLLSMNDDLDTFPAGCYIEKDGMKLNYNPKLNSNMNPNTDAFTLLCDCRTFDKDFPFYAESYNEDGGWPVNDDNELVGFYTKTGYSGDTTSLLHFKADVQYATFEKLRIRKVIVPVSSTATEAEVGNSYVAADTIQVANIVAEENVGEPYVDAEKELVEANAGFTSEMKAALQQFRDEHSDLVSEKETNAQMSQSTVRQTSEDLDESSAVNTIIMYTLASIGVLSVICVGYSIACKNDDKDYADVDVPQV